MYVLYSRPDSWNTSIIPDANMLRKLVRDRNCSPVLRGIFESLLHYLTQDLPKCSTRKRNLEEPESGSVAVRDSRKDCPDQSSKKQTQLQLTEEHQRTQKMTAETSSRVLEKCCSDPQKERLSIGCGEDQRAGDFIPRRLTTFQLLQSKFTRSTPRPSITHQRQVGALSSSIGVAGKVNHSQDGEHDNHKKDQVKRQLGQKRGGSVKDMVAKFAMAEQKEGRLNVVQNQPVKPRLIGRGILLSSLMERFETIATVCKGSDLKRSNKRSSGGIDKKVTSCIKQKVACYEKEQQQAVDKTVRKRNQHKPMKSKSVGQQLKINLIANGEERPEQAVDILTKVNSNLGEVMRQIGDQPSDQKAAGHCSLKHMNGQAYDNNIEGWRSGEDGKIQTTADETRITSRLKYGCLELLCLTSASEWSPPEPCRLSPQVETSLNWHVATITTCSTVWSTCVDSSAKQYQQEETKPETSEKTPIVKKHGPGGALQYNTHGETTEVTVKPKVQGLSTDAGHDPMESRAAEDPNRPTTETIQRRLRKYVIPRVYRLDYEQGDHPDQTSSSSQSAPDREAITPPSQSDTSPTALNAVLRAVVTESFQALQDTSSSNPITLHNITKMKSAEAKPRENDREAGEEKEIVTLVDIKDTDMQQSLRLSEDTGNKVEFEDSNNLDVTLPEIKPERDKPKERPKYTTINYGDPSVKQTYKPKTIRFTDTFTF